MSNVSVVVKSLIAGSVAVTCCVGRLGSGRGVRSRSGEDEGSGSKRGGVAGWATGGAGVEQGPEDGRRTGSAFGVGEETG